MNSIKYIYICLMAMFAVSCSVSVPESYDETDAPIPCVPCADNAVIPPNIAPMNFYISVDADDYVTWIHSSKSDVDIMVGGRDVVIPEGDWHSLLDQIKGDTLQTDVFVCHSGKWTHYPPMRYMVAEEPIDPYISYRLIEPSYVTYEGITINERCLENYDQEIVYSNSFMADKDVGQCVNCHNYQNHNRDGNMQLHLRERQGGTVISYEGQLRKVNLKTDSTMSAGVYPAWHPSLPLIAYSVNATGQVFHTRDTQKVEVIDFGSDMILYDIKENKVYTVADDKDEYETFPAWSPDGKYLYYTSAHYEQKGDDIDAELDSAYQSLKYNIYRFPFDVERKTFGSRELVFDARSMGKSAALPRISPDGKHLLFGISDFGNFHIWHKSSDLAVLDLDVPATQPLADAQVVVADSSSADSVRPLSDYEGLSMFRLRLLDDANSESVDSYHSWSSNGRWIIFASRRDDDNYSRVYISYFDKSGIAHKPFILPQKDPHHYLNLFKSFNVPEFMVQPVQPSRQELQRIGAEDPTPAEYAGRCAD